MTIRTIPCALVRGGTSKGVFIEARHLPECPVERDRLILALFGSPDRRQIDGLGGADPLTSKLAIVAPSACPGVDLTYTFAQVGIASPEVNFEGSCGNLPAGIGLFALARGLLPQDRGDRGVRVLNLNTGKHIRLRFGGAECAERIAIDGVPGCGAEVRMEFEDPGGALTGSLLPTGAARDTLHLRGGEVEVSIVDAGSLYAFVAASRFGRTGWEPIEELEEDLALASSLDEVRRYCARILLEKGAIDAAREKALERHLKVAMIGGGSGSNGFADLHARIFNPERWHRAFAVTGAIALGAARSIEGSLAAEAAGVPSCEETVVGHPCGTLRVRVHGEGSGSGWHPISAEISRTARILMDGIAYLPE